MSNRHVNLDQLRERAARAVAQSREAASDWASPPSGDGENHLVEELRIYQTELEIQNQELGVAQSEVSSLLEKYRNLFDNLPLPSIVIDSRGFIVEANLQARDLLGLSSVASLQHRSALQLFDTDSRERLYKVLRDRVCGQPQVLDFLHLNLGQRQNLICGVHVIHLHDESRHEEQSILMLVDQSAEVALQKSEARFRQLFEKNGSVMLLIEPDEGTIAAANQAALDYYGYPTEQLVGMSIAAINTLPADELAIERQKAKLEGRNYFNFTHRLAAGELRNVEVYSTPVAVSEKTMLLAIVHDVTERKRLQQDLQERMAELGTILDNSSVGISFVKDRKQVWANRRMGEMFGYTLEEMQGRSTSLMYLCEENYNTLGSQAYELMRQGSRYTTEMQMRHQDGSPLWMRLSGQAITPGNLADGSIWVFEDIAQQKQLEKDLLHAKLQAEAANIAKSRFLATMSHEIRTPMNAILGMAQMLLTPKLEEYVRYDYARTIVNSGLTLLALLNDILDLSKVESGNFQLDSRAFDPEQILRETRALFAENATMKGIALELAKPVVASSGYLGDPFRLCQMLSNLVSNAIKFTPAGKVTIAVSEINRRGRTAELEFAVSDTGIGIPAEKRQLLFQPFSQADNTTTRHYGGTGLGLFIVSSLSKHMGGQAGVESEPGQGSRFWFRILADAIPAGAERRQHQRSELNHAGLAAVTMGLSGRVLVAEDNPTNRKVALALLNKLGLTVVFVEDGQQAVDAIRQGETADLILMDLHMPILDGYDATQRIRQWETEQSRPRRPIIALTADAYEEDRQHCLTIGMDDFLAKPIAIETLKEVLCKWLPEKSRLPCTGTAASPSERMPDVAQVTQLLRQLEPLLQRNEFDAIHTFRDLLKAVQGSHIAAEIEAAGECLAECRFDEALDRLHQIAASQSWNLLP